MIRGVHAIVDIAGVQEKLYISYKGLVFGWSGGRVGTTKSQQQVHSVMRNHPESLNETNYNYLI